MRRFTPVFRILALFLAVYAFGYARSGHPALAQDDPPPAPVVEEEVKMAYQPPAEADTFADFTSAQATEITVSAPNRTVADFTEESIAQLDAGSTQPAAQIDQATITASSETAFNVNNGELGIIIESGTVTDTASLSLTSLVVQEPSPTQTISIDAATMMTFQLELEDATGTKIEEFNKPVRLVVDLRTYGIDLDEVGGRFYLAYEDEAHPGEWREVDITSYGSDGLISTETRHFSDWAAGWRPEAWALEWKPPVANEFTGAASYGYGFNIPPGRAGLQPSVSLSYSSASLRGAVRKTPMGTVATGWSLSDINITRVGIRKEVNGWIFPDQFRLAINGIGGRLIHQGLEGGVHLYFVEDNPQLRVYNYGGTDRTSENSYWIVKDGSGNQYRLGYTNNSLSYQGADSNDPGDEFDVTSNIAWHVDTITDSFGNQINYEYNNEVPRTEYLEYGCPWFSCDWRTSTYNSQVTEISYNFDNRIANANLPASDTVHRLRNGATAGSHITFTYDANDGNRLAMVNVYHGNFPHPSRRYVIEAVTVQIPGSNGLCDVRSEPVNTDTRIIEWIEEQALNPQNGAVISALPKTAFEYQTLHHIERGDGDCFRYKYLSAVENGYGGRIEISYDESDKRQAGGTFEPCNWSINPPSSCDVSYPSLGFNYSVRTIKQYDGIQANPLVMQYDYAGRCYDQVGSCPQPETSDDNGNIGGYNVITVTNSAGGDVLNSRTTSYFQTMEKFGKPSWSRFRDENGTVLTKTITEYAVDGFGSPNVRFTYAISTRNYTYRDGEDSDAISTKTRYDYQTDQQDEAQYGNVTHIYEYDDAGTNINNPDRTISRWYRVNTTGNNWIIRQTSEGIYEGGSSTPLLISWNYYDFGNHGDAPTQGRLTRTRQLMPGEINCGNVNNNGGSGCDTAYQTVDQDFTYDVYGNLKSSTSYSDYGHQTQDTIAPANWDLKDVTPLERGATATTSSIAYDNEYHLYPISVHDGMVNHAPTAFEIYGFNGALNGFQTQPGLLKQVTDPNGTATAYEYDPFGRLHAVYDGYTDGEFEPFEGFGDTDPWNGNPVTLNRYWDNNWNYNNVQWLDPANDAPFLITQKNRPGTYPNPVHNPGGSGYDFSIQTMHDGFGRPIQTRQFWAEVDGQNERREIITTTEYNAQGQVACQTTPFDIAYYKDGTGVWPDSPYMTDSCASKPHTTTTYDAQGRPTKVTAPDGNPVLYYYSIQTKDDPQTGLNATVSNNYDTVPDYRNPGVPNAVMPNGPYHVMSVVSGDAGDRHATTQFSNARGQMVYMTELKERPNQTPLWLRYATTTYSYDLMGNLTDVQDELLNRTQMEYDALGRKTGMDDPDMGHWGYGYDTAGNLIDQLDANDNRLCFFYDALNRLGRKVAMGEATPCPTDINQAPSDGLGHLASYDYDRVEFLEEFENNTLPNGWGSSGNTSVSGGQVHVTGNNTWGNYVSRTDTQQDGEGMRTSFKLTGSNPNGAIYLKSDTYGASDYRRLGLYIDSGAISWETYEGTTHDSGSEPLMALEIDTWYELQLVVDGETNGFYVAVWERDDPSVSGHHTQLPTAEWAGLDWSFLVQMNRGVANVESHTTFVAGDTAQLATVAWGDTPSQNRDTFHYDSFGRVTAQTRAIDGQEYTMSTTAFDSLSRPTAMQYPDGEIVTVGYDHEGGNSLIAGVDTLVSDVLYNQHGQTTAINLGNQTATTFDYANANGNYRLHSLSRTPLSSGDVITSEVAIGEVGFIDDSLTDAAQTVVLNRVYENPVVFAQPVSADGSAASIIRITDLQSDRFTLHMDEAPGQDGIHTSESVSYMVVEAGVWELADGTLLEVGRTRTNATMNVIGQVWKGVSFSQPFASKPVVMSQVQSNNDPHWVKTRQHNVTSAGFNVALEEDEAQTTFHGQETIGWMAIEAGQGSWNEHLYEAAETANAVTQNWYQINFAQSFSQTPRFMGGLSTFDGGDTSYLRYNRTSLTATGVQVMVEEDVTQDSEVAHTTEAIGFVAIQGDGLLTAVVTQINPLLQSSYGYDAVGNITSIVDSLGDEQLFGYDHLNRLTTVNGSYTHIYKYNEIGNMIRMDDGVTNKLYTYEPPSYPANRNYEHAQPHAVTQAGNDTFIYDAVGNMIERQQGTEETYAQQFDVENRLTVVTNTTTAEVTQFYYDHSGQRVMTIEPNGIVKYTPFPNYEVEQWPEATVPPTITITADGQSPLSVDYGDTYTVAWQVDGAVSCSASGDWEGELLAAGSEQMVAVADHNYMISCTNSAGSSSKSVSVNVADVSPPTLTFTANGRGYLSVGFKESYTLAWNAAGDGLSSCTASGAWQGNKPFSGSEVMPGQKVEVTLTYHLLCTNPNGNTIQTVTVHIGGFIIGLPGTKGMVTMDEGAVGAPLSFVEEKAIPGGGTQPVQAVITRKTYSLAGQAIAVRVSGDPNANNNGLFYIHSDHLGSTSAMSYGNGHAQEGQLVPDSLTRFTPFGDYRTGGQSDITDRGFTGHKENDYIKLVDMKARWYAPAIGRFISPDTIVPDPANPQSLNRYSYVNNNPIRYTDPTGHYTCEDTDCNGGPDSYTRPFTSPFFNFTGGVTLAEKQMAHQAGNAIGQQMANVVNPLRRMESRMNGTGYTSLSAEDAFLSVFGGPITIHNKDEYLVDNGGFKVYAIASETEALITIGKQLITNHYLFIHEIFHNFDIVVLGGAANSALWDIQRPKDSSFPNRPNLSGNSSNRWGFAGPNFSPWQKSRSGTSGEEFADMGIGWTYGQWNTKATGALTTDGQHRAGFMSQHMGSWILQALGQ